MRVNKKNWNLALKSHGKPGQVKEFNSGKKWEPCTSNQWHYLESQERLCHQRRGPKKSKRFREDNTFLYQRLKN